MAPFMTAHLRVLGPLRGTVPPSATQEAEALAAVRTLLVGASTCALPPLSELLMGLGALHGGRRPKVLLQAPGARHEFALCRRGNVVEVSVYEIEGALFQLDRRVELQALVHATAKALQASHTPAAAAGGSPAGRHASGVSPRTDDGPAEASGLDARLLAIADRIALEPMAADPLGNLPDRVIAYHASRQDDPTPAPVALSCEVRLRPGATAWTTTTSQSDYHALLFAGELTLWLQGRPIRLEKGPVFVLLMAWVEGIRAVLDAWQEGLPLQHLALGAAGARIETKLSGRDEVTLKAHTDKGEMRFARGLSLAHIALPVLRLASDLLRGLVEVDRAQQRNLHVRRLRQDIRELRRRVRQLDTSPSLETFDAERVRFALAERDRCLSEPAAAPLTSDTRHYAPRWEYEVDGLDATSTYLVGDTLVVGTPRRRLALDAATGGLRWDRPTNHCPTLVAGPVMLELRSEGSVELFSLTDGESFARAKVSWSAGAPANGVYAGGGSLPDLAILPLRHHELVALDLQTGAPRWKYATKAPGPVRWRRLGRVLFVTGGDGVVHAVDVASGEPLWRLTHRSRFFQPPAVCGETLVLTGGNDRRRGRCIGVDVFSGRVRWSREIPCRPVAPPTAAGADCVLLQEVSPRGPALTAIDPETGANRWQVFDRILSEGTSLLADESGVYINSGDGHALALDTQTGHLLWQRRLADPLSDHVPRKLEIVADGTQLFIPSAQLHVVNRTTGLSVAPALACDLVPDVVKLDRPRGWLYVAEESGYIKAFAQTPSLRLVK